MAEEDEGGEKLDGEAGAELIALGGGSTSLEKLYEAADDKVAKEIVSVIQTLWTSFEVGKSLPSLKMLLELAAKVRRKEHLKPEAYQSFAEMLLECFTAAEREAAGMGKRTQPVGGRVIEGVVIDSREMES
jgi:hypothetical protein